MRVALFAAIVALGLSAISASALADVMIVNDNFDDTANPGWFHVANQNVPSPSLDFSGGQLDLSTAATSATETDQRYDNTYAMRPFSGIDLGVGDYLEAKFVLNAPSIDGAENLVRSIRALQLVFIGSGDETLPTGDTAFAGNTTTGDQDVVLSDGTSWSAGVAMTPGNTQLLLPIGNPGGTGGPGDNDKLFSASPGTKTSGGGGINLAQGLEDGSTVKLRVTRLAEGTIDGEVEGGEYMVTLTVIHNDGLDTTESLEYAIAGNRNDREMGTLFDHFAIGLSDITSLAADETGAVQIQLDDFMITTSVPEPASLALLGMGGLALLRRHR